MFVVMVYGLRLYTNELKWEETMYWDRLDHATRELSSWLSNGAYAKIEVI